MFHVALEAISKHLGVEIGKFSFSWWPPLFIHPSAVLGLSEIRSHRQHPPWDCKFRLYRVHLCD